MHWLFPVIMYVYEFLLLGIENRISCVVDNYANTVLVSQRNRLLFSYRGEFDLMSPSQKYYVAGGHPCV